MAHFRPGQASYRGLQERLQTEPDKRALVSGSRLYEERVREGYGNASAGVKTDWDVVVAVVLVVDGSRDATPEKGGDSL